MRVQVNQNNEVINIVHPAVSSIEADQVDIASVDFDLPEEGFGYIEDLYYGGVPRYYLDESDIMYRRSDEDIKALQDYEDNKMVEIRAQRDELLQKTDFTQGADAPLTAQQITDYATYRQELRDLPANITDVDDVTWPTEPE